MRLGSALKWLFEQEVIRESAPAMPLAEIAGDERVLIENHHGVTEYTDERICVRVAYGNLRVIGQNLTLHCVKKHQLVICGVIQKLEIERLERGSNGR